jgi:regulator of sigma E protease
VNLPWQHLLAFIFAVCLLVSVHEYGHYWVARKLGFKVLRFSVGFGRALWKRVAGPDRTEYVLAAIPIGGYVKLLDEREGPVAPEELSRSFTRRPHWQRIAVLLAGPAANFIFAIVVLTGLYWASGTTEVRPLVGVVTAGSPGQRAGLQSGDEILAIDGQATPGADAVVLRLIDRISGSGPIEFRVRGADGRQRDLRLPLEDAAERRRLSDPAALLTGLGFRFRESPVPPVLGTVEPNGPAARAGLRNGDRVLSVGADPVQDFPQLVQLIRSRPGETLSLHIRRDAAEMTVPVTVAAESVEGKTIGRIQVRQPATVPYEADMVRHVDLGPVAAFAYACERSWDVTALQARLLWRMLFGQVSVKNISGPITIAQMAGESAIAGVASFLWFLVMVSLALGFMNLLPIPILDGGQIVMQTIEWLKGSPLSERAQIAGQQVGIMLVMLLMGLALYNDIARQFG